MSEDPKLPAQTTAQFPRVQLDLIRSTARTEAEIVVAEALAPKKVTSQVLLVHALILVVTYCAMLFLCYLYDVVFSSDDLIEPNFLGALAFSVLLWLASFAMSVVARLQTKTYGLSSILIASTALTSVITVQSYFLPYLNYFFRNRHVAMGYHVALLIIYGAIFGEWYIAKVLPTSSRRVIRGIAVLLAAGMLSLVAWYTHSEADEPKQGFDVSLSVVPLPFTLPASKQDFDGKLDKAFDEVSKFSREDD